MKLGEYQRLLKDPQKFIELREEILCFYRDYIESKSIKLESIKRKAEREKRHLTEEEKKKYITILNEMESVLHNYHLLR